MPRRKQLIFKIQDLKCAVHIIEELSKLPQLNNFDMKSIELTIKENKPAYTLMTGRVKDYIRETRDKQRTG